MDAKEVLKILSKQWCSVNDLMKIMCIGRNKALTLRNQIKHKLIEDGYIVPSYNLPMQAVVDILKIDIDYLRKMNE